MYKSFIKVLKNRKAQTQRVSSPRAGEDAAKRQVRGLAKSINRKAQTQSVSLSLPFFPLTCQREGRVRAGAKRQSHGYFAVAMSTIVAIVLSVIPEIRYRESAVSRGSLTTATIKAKGRFPITTLGNDNTGRSSLPCNLPLPFPFAVIADLLRNLKNRKAQTQHNFAVALSTIVAIVLSVIPEIRYRESAVSRGCLIIELSAAAKTKGRFPITTFGNDNTGRSAFPRNLYHREVPNV